MSIPTLTPDGRYIVVTGKTGARLWRATNPNLSQERREKAVKRLMNARRAVRDAQGNEDALHSARAEVDAAKHELGERGPVWWDDGTPDLNRRLVKNTPYSSWWNAVRS
jgi:hypothetical protein